MLLYRTLHLCKFVGVLLIGGGTLAGLSASSTEERRRAVHGFASPGLLLTWAAGYLLSLLLNVALTELWILGGLVSSFALHLALVLGVSQKHSRSTVLAVIAPLFVTLLLMVFRPTWAQVLP
ncbi:MAG: hypothetical protein ABW061_20290 [Polyangiaceae bacterium]